MKYLTLHETVINETVLIMNAVFDKLKTPLIIRRIRRSDIIWQQRKARRNLLQPEKNQLNWKWLFNEYRKNKPAESGVEQTAYVFCLKNPPQERAAFLLKSCWFEENDLEINALENFYRKTPTHPLKGQMLYFSLCIMVTYAEGLDQNNFLEKEKSRFLIKDIVNEDVMRFYMSEAPLAQLAGKMECESNYFLLSEYMNSKLNNRTL